MALPGSISTFSDTDPTGSGSGSETLLKIIKNINSQKLFTGPANGEVMIDTFLRYKDPAVQELTDTTFEHLTQVQPGGLPAYLLGLTTVYREITYSIIIKYAVLTLCSSWSVN